MSRARCLRDARPPLRWALLVVVSAGVLVVFSRIGVPSPEILAGMLAALVFALVGFSPGSLPRPLNSAIQALIGVDLGMMVTSEQVRALGQSWLPVLVVTVVTLALSFGSGFLLARHRSVDRVTGVLSMAAGGASGLVLVADQLGGDQRLVGVLQYTRVVLITASTPPLAAWIFGAPRGPAPLDGSIAGWGTLVAMGCVVVGLALGRLSRIPAGDLLVPMAMTAALAIWGGLPLAELPGPLLLLAYVMIGWTATLGFTRATLSVALRVLPIALALTIALLVVCALTGVWLAHQVGLPALDGYLATTPGGMLPIMAIAAGANSNATFISAVQALRLFLMLALTPLLTQWLQRTTCGRSADPGQG